MGALLREHGVRKTRSGQLTAAALILLSAEFYLLYMFLDWRVGNWSVPEARGAGGAAGLALALALGLQPFCAWLLIRAGLPRPAFIAALSTCDRPLPWRYTLALTATAAMSFGCAIALYLASGIPLLGSAQNELATWLQRLLQ